MLRPSSLIRFATLAGLALFVRAIVRENDEQSSTKRLPPPRRKSRPALLTGKAKSAAASRH